MTSRLPTPPKRLVPARVWAAVLLAAPLLFAALLAPILASAPPPGAAGGGFSAPIPWDPLVVDLGSRLRPPSLAHLFGTDELGRDVLSRLLHGTRLSVGAGLLAASAAFFFGILAGGAGVLLGRRGDRAVAFSVDVVQALPPLVLVAAGAAFAPPSFLTAAVLIALTAWPDSTRVVTAGARAALSAPFVEAARAAGAGRTRLLFRHVLPHALPPAVASLPYTVGAAAMAEAALSFLGLGTPPPSPSWGRALADARSVLPGAWWCAAFPSGALLLLVVACRRLGDALSARLGGLESPPSA